MNKHIGNSWDIVLNDEFNKEYFKKLEERIDNEYDTYLCHPDKDLIFNAFILTPIEKIKVVIIGQDPYFNENQAMGLSFSVKEGIKKPPSLENIFKEMQNDVNLEIPKSGDLTLLAKEGVFLLNATLSVRDKEPLSHKGLGWETFTDNVISLLNKVERPIVFILWGNNAKEKERLITSSHHLIIKSSHPSPLGAYNGFFNSKPFSRANKFLMSNSISPVDWNIIEE